MLISGSLYCHWKEAKRIFEYPLDVLVLALFIANALQAIGGILNFHWINIGKVEVGGFCNVQGIIQTVGNTSVAFGNILITAFTCYGVSTLGDLSTRATSLSVGVSFIFSIIIVTVGNTLNSKFMVPTPYWCWINKDYFLWQLFSEYLWLWIALFWSILMHNLLIFWYRPWNFNSRTRTWLHPLVKTMLWFPLTYSISILPLSIIRWNSFVQEKRHGTAHIPASAIFASNVIFILGGLFNAIFLVTMRPGLFGLRARRVAEIEIFPMHAPDEISSMRVPDDMSSMHLPQISDPKEISFIIPSKYIDPKFEKSPESSLDDLK